MPCALQHVLVSAQHKEACTIQPLQGQEMSKWWKMSKRWPHAQPSNHMLAPNRRVRKDNFNEKIHVNAKRKKPEKPEKEYQSACKGGWILFLTCPTSDWLFFKGGGGWGIQITEEFARYNLPKVQAVKLTFFTLCQSIQGLKNTFVILLPSARESRVF